MTFEQWRLDALVLKLRLDPDFAAWVGKDRRDNARIYVGRRPSYAEMTATASNYRYAIIEPGIETGWSRRDCGGNIIKAATDRLWLMDKSDEDEQHIYDGLGYLLAILEPLTGAIAGLIDDDTLPDWHTINVECGTMKGPEEYQDDKSLQGSIPIRVTANNVTT